MATSLISIVGGGFCYLPRLRMQPVTKKEFLSLARGRGDGYAIRDEWLHLHHRS